MMHNAKTALWILDAVIYIKCLQDPAANTKNKGFRV